MAAAKPESLQVLVDSTARESGLAQSLTGVQPGDKGAVRVQLEHADFNMLAGWLARLFPPRTDIRVESATMTGSNSPGVNATVSAHALTREPSRMKHLVWAGIAAFPADIAGDVACKQGCRFPAAATTMRSMERIRLAWTMQGTGGEPAWCSAAAGEPAAVEAARRRIAVVAAKADFSIETPQGSGRGQVEANLQGVVILRDVSASAIFDRRLFTSLAEASTRTTGRQAFHLQMQGLQLQALSVSSQPGLPMMARRQCIRQLSPGVPDAAAPPFVGRLRRCRRAGLKSPAR